MWQLWESDSSSHQGLWLLLTVVVAVYLNVFSKLILYNLHFLLYVTTEDPIPLALWSASDLIEISLNI